MPLTECRTQWIIVPRRTQQALCPHLGSDLGPCPKPWTCLPRDLVAAHNQVAAHNLVA